MSFSVKTKGEQDKNRPDFVKISLVIFKTGYTRVYKVLPITGLWKNWDKEIQSFIPKTADANINNALLSDTLGQYIQQINLWERQGKNWTPKELKAEFSKTQEQLLKEVVPTVEQLFQIKIKELQSKTKVKNGHVLTHSTHAKNHEKVLEYLKQFTKDKYGRNFSNYHFSDLDETFLDDYATYIQSEGIKKGNRNGIRTKLNILYMIVDKARMRGIPGANLEAFDITDDRFQEPETESKALDMSIIRALENLDASLFTETELFYIDIFLFCFYCGGMAPIDSAYLTWSSIDKEKRKITYERIKYPKIARPPFLPRAEKIAEKYKDQCCGDYVLPLFTRTDMTEMQRKSRMNYLSLQVSATLRRAMDVLGVNVDNICWYSARGTYITMMLDRKYDPGIVAQHCGNSVLTIYKNYFKNLKERDIIAELCLEFAA